MTNNTITLQMEGAPKEASTPFLPSNRVNHQGRIYSRQCCKEDTCGKVIGCGIISSFLGSIVGFGAASNAYSACNENCDGYAAIALISGIAMGAFCIFALCKGSSSSRGPCGHIT